MRTSDSNSRRRGSSLRRFLGLAPRSGEEALDRQSRLRALRDAMEGFMAPPLSESEVLQRFCQLMRTHGLAQWVAVVRPELEDRLDVLALAGSHAVLAGLSWSFDPDGDGGGAPLALVWREQRPFYSDPLFPSAALRPWRQRMAGHGLHSTAVLPLTRRGQPWALLVLLHHDEIYWSSDSQMLLESIVRWLCQTLEYRDQEAFQNLLGRGLAVANESVVLTDAQRRVLYVNPSFERMTGYRLEDLNDGSLRVLQGPDTDIHELAVIDQTLRAGLPYSGTLLNYRRDGEPYWNQLSIVPVRDPNGDIRHYLGIQRDVSAEKKLVSQLEYESRHDRLTGLANRRALDDELEMAMARADRYGTRLAACMIDLDGFKPINDCYGHDAGDQVLQVIARRLRNSVRRYDYVARLGGDEFVLLLERVSHPAELEQIFIKLECNVNEAITLRNYQQIGVRLTMGVCLYPEHGARDAGELLRFADQALYHGKAHKETRERYWTYYTETIGAPSQTNPQLSGTDKGWYR